MQLVQVTGERGRKECSPDVGTASLRPGLRRADGVALGVSHVHPTGAVPVPWPSPRNSPFAVCLPYTGRPPRQGRSALPSLLTGSSDTLGSLVRWCLSSWGFVPSQGLTCPGSFSMRSSLQQGDGFANVFEASFQMKEFSREASLSCNAFPSRKMPRSA